MYRNCTVALMRPVFSVLVYNLLCEYISGQPLNEVVSTFHIFMFYYPPPSWPPQNQKYLVQIYILLLQPFGYRPIQS